MAEKYNAFEFICPFVTGIPAPFMVLFSGEGVLIFLAGHLYRRAHPFDLAAHPFDLPQILFYSETKDVR